MKNLRLSADCKRNLRDDLRKLPGGRNALRRTWENYLSGKKPNHTLTFDPDAAIKDRDSFFITAMHPLAKQAADILPITRHHILGFNITHQDIPAGEYVFSVLHGNIQGSIHIQS